VNAHLKIIRVSQNSFSKVTTLEFGDGTVVQVPGSALLAMKFHCKKPATDSKNQERKTDQVIQFRHKGWGSFAFDS
jgi:hypothetical protein